MKPDTTKHQSAQHGKGKKVFDISRPGNTPASANSRPVIVGHPTKIQDNINGISAPSSERSSSRATNPDDTHRDLMSSKTRVVVQPAGTLNQEAQTPPSTPVTNEPKPAQPISQETPDHLVDFDLTSLSDYEPDHVPEASERGRNDDAKPSETQAHSKDGSDAESDSPQSQQKTKPQKHADHPQDAWITAAVKDLGSASNSPVAPPPESLIVSEYVPQKASYMKLVLVIALAATLLVAGTFALYSLLS